MLGKVAQRISIALAGAVAFAACASAAASSPGGSGTQLRLGYFANITHAPALIEIESGSLQTALGNAVTLHTTTFAAGPAAVEALFAGSIDAAYIGPNPAINAYAKSHGEAIRIVSGATSGGAFLVVRDGIKTAPDLTHTKIATPQLGGTQDVALRSWLATAHLSTDTVGGGDVSIVPQENARTLDALKTGAIDGAWVPEPWASRLVADAHAHVLVDERTLWPAGQYATTQLVVRTTFLAQHPEIVQHLIEANSAAIDFATQHPAEAQILANARIKKITQKTINAKVLAAAWKNLTFTVDPIASSLQRSADAEVAIGFITAVDLHGIFDLTLLNRFLVSHNRPKVAPL